MLDFLVQADTDLLIWIHQHLHNDMLDAIIPLFRNKWFWIPVYVFLMAFLLINYRSRGWIWVLIMLFGIGVADTTSSKLIKRSVDRLRPCHVEHVEAQLNMLVPCGGKYSFTSSHAANHFTMAILIFLTLGRRFRKVRWPVIAWAALVGFAQVYVGVHYPLDIVGGALLGLLIGGVLAWYFNSQWGFDEGTTPLSPPRESG